ncbi:MAG: aminotransferase class V-fold PLP-dependent enzyme, partial [Actinomycetota bacterium]|nr:aminotransferase class V-fold PLP-dependent enzyme [Actinomycetota bacterium]
DNISLISAMTANNETGVINPITDIAELLEERFPSTYLHTDAVQATAWMDLAKYCEGAHLISITGHKFGGPKGAGALIIKKGVPFLATQRGGGQERERRSGTQNVPAIVGLGKAAQIMMSEREILSARVTDLRNQLEEKLIALIPDTFRTLPAESNRTPQIAHLCFKDVESESLLFLLEQEGIAASAASSCASGAQQVSHVLQAMGIDYEKASGSIRLSLGWTTTEEEINHALNVIPQAVTQLREYSK